MMRITLAGISSGLPRTARRTRIWELDFIRGLLLLIITLDHVCIFAPSFISATTAFGDSFIAFCRNYYYNPARPFIQPLIIFAIAFLSGINGSFSRNHFKRALQICGFTAAFILLHHIGTKVVPSFCTGKVLFNILAVLSICSIVWAVVEKLKVPDWVLWLISCVTLATGLYFTLLYALGSTVVLPEGWKWAALLVHSQQGLVISQNDFVPLFPSLGFFLVGGLYGRRVYKSKKESIFHVAAPKVFSPVLWVGKKSLWIYFFAPVVIVGFLKVLNLLRLI